MSYLTAISISLLSLLFLIRFNKKINIVDQPNSRSSHIKPLPRTGGIAIILGLIPTLFIFFSNYFGHFTLGAIILVFFLGLYDDIRGLNANIKFIFIFLATIIIQFDGIIIKSLGQYFEWNFTLGWLSLPFTLLAVGGITNGINLIDGLDGLAAGLSSTILIAFAYIGYKFESIPLFTLATLLIAILILFLFFNFHPAKIFMGDSGSLSLGFSIAVLATLSLKYIHPVTILYLCAIPIIDTLVVMLRRIFTKQNPFSADKNHIHHILFYFFKSVRLTVIFIILLQTLFCYIGYVVARQINLYPTGLLPLATVISFIILIILNYIVFTTMLNYINKKSYLG